MEEVEHIVVSNGNQAWQRVIDGAFHRENDLPAIIRANGDQEWYINGNRHRENDLPAVIWANGDQHWFINGRLHRENDKPASIRTNGDQLWYVKGEQHRDNNKPAVITSSKVKYYIHGNKTKEEPYDSEKHDRFKFISGRKTKAVNCHVQLEHDN